MTVDRPPPPAFARFRGKLWLAMMVVVSAAMALALFFAQRSASADAKRELAHAFQSELAALHSVQEVRHAILAERCRVLARKPRLHAALEDNALDLLYPSARDELADVMDRPGETAPYALRARFYRFLDAKGQVISPPDQREVGALPAPTEARLALPAVPNRVQTGYLVRDPTGTEGAIDEVIAMPVLSTETAEPIAALVLGFAPFDPAGQHPGTGIKGGIWVDGVLQLPALPRAARDVVAGQLAHQLSRGENFTGDFSVEIEGTPCLLFYRQLNPGSLFPPAYEVIVYPLTESLAQQRRLLWRFAGVWAVLLIGALAASHVVAGRLSRPVEELAVDSEENRTQRQRAEAALEVTHEELQRSARFSANASHQLKTPVTVLRAGLEELLAGEKLAGDMREEVSNLVHQTFRLTSIIEDLLLLSRMDAGRLKLEFRRLDLTELIEAALDDLGALPDGQELAIETEFPPMLPIVGERRYASLILQNLLENARKYNRPGGRIRLEARVGEACAVVTVGNTGPGIPAAAQAHIFERFHRGSMGENVPGHGLGLNLARQLARLHRGDLNLVRSDEDWTEFEIRFQLADTPDGMELTS